MQQAPLAGRAARLVACAPRPQAGAPHCGVHEPSGPAASAGRTSVLPLAVAVLALAVLATLLALAVLALAVLATLLALAVLATLLAVLATLLAVAAASGHRGGARAWGAARASGRARRAGCRRPGPPGAHPGQSCRAAGPQRRRTR